MAKTKTEKPAAGKPAAGKTVALLGEGGLLLGYGKVAEADWRETSAQVPVPEGCDLEPRQYRWDGQTFQPLPRRPRGADHDAVAIAQGLKAVERALERIFEDGFALPADTAAWCGKIDARFRHVLSAFDEAEKDSR